MVALALLAPIALTACAAPLDGVVEAGARAPRAAHGALADEQDEERLWLRARELASADPRAAAAAARGALALGEGPPAQEWQAFAFQLGVSLALDFRAEEALALQTELHRRVDAPWSAQDRARSLVRLGRYPEAEAWLAESLVRWPREPELWNERGLVALAAGDEAAARRHLGAALRRGSLGAALTLGRMELAAGEREAALARLRPRIGAEGPSDWALRGWGLALLERYPGAPGD